MKNAMKLSSVICLGIALVFFAVAQIGGQRIQTFIDENEHAVGVIRELDGSADRMLVTFDTANGAQTVWLSEYSSTFAVGQSINVYYRADDPHDAHTDVLLMLARVFRYVGWGLLALSAAMWFGFRMRETRRERTLRDGTRVSAQISQIREVKSVSYGAANRHPYQVICTFADPQTGERRTARSRYLTGDPTDALQGKPIEVVVDGKRCEVDVDKALNA